MNSSDVAKNLQKLVEFKEWIRELKPKNPKEKESLENLVEQLNSTGCCWTAQLFCKHPDVDHDGYCNVCGEHTWD